MGDIIFMYVIILICSAQCKILKLFIYDCLYYSEQLKDHETVQYNDYNNDTGLHGSNM